MTFTVIGASGFIGAAVAARLERIGEDVHCPIRETAELFARPLGHVICAAGITADFRTRPFDTLRANTSLIADVLEKADFTSLVYLSSARIYRHAEYPGEDAAIFLRPSDPEDLYDFTKLTGEALCHASNRGNVRIVRLTNVVGPNFRSNDFLFDLIRSACDDGVINLRTGLRSEKDYVRLDDVLDLLPLIAVSGRHACYNLGGGCNLSHADIVEAITSRGDVRVNVAEKAPDIVFPRISIARLADEFDFRPRPLVDYIASLVDDYRKQTC
jgi:nucleoside-diphosphate-sugar epimerase